ncbi:MAG: transcription factor S [Candidatus Lokiarchaeota archaeon]|nr:transcription factor S [Candidatus Lokiarchaeota archaeon]
MRCKHVEFCEECGQLLYPSRDKDGNKIFICRSCGYTRKLDKEEEKASENYRIGNKIEHSETEFTPVIEEEINVMGEVNEECSKCGHNKAYYWHVQTRSGDEGMTTFYRCKKCKHTWREY